MKSETRNRHLSFTIGAGVLVGVLVFLFHQQFARNDFFFDDAADYIRASDSPFLSTWLNTNSASPIELLRLRQDQQFRARPWDYLYMAKDNAALRHFHGPASFYALHVVRSFSKSAQPVRLLISFVASLTCAVMVIALATFSVPLPLAMLLALYVGVQGWYIEISFDPSPHTWYILSAFTFLFFIVRYLLTNKNRDLYLAAVAFAAAFATMEFSVELIAGVPLAVILIAFFAEHRFPAWPALQKPLIKAAALFFFVTFLLWPGGWLRGGYFETYGAMGLEAGVMNRGTARYPLMNVIYQRLLGGQAMFLVAGSLCVAGVLILLFRRRLSIATIVFSSYSLIAFGIGLTDHFALSTYKAEFKVFLFATVGLITVDVSRAFFHRTFSRRAFFSILALTVAIGCITGARHTKSLIVFRPWLGSIFDGVRQNVPAGETLLVTDRWQPLWLYLPEYRFEPTETKWSAEPRIKSRAAQIRYGLFDGAVPPPPGSLPLATYSTFPGHTTVLWKTVEGHAPR